MGNGDSMDIEFSSLDELYKRIYPALKTKKNELKRCGYEYIKEKDIWTYLSTTKWKTSKGLMLSNMVSDILNADNEKIDKYLKETLKKRSDVYDKTKENIYN